MQSVGIGRTAIMEGIAAWSGGRFVTTAVAGLVSVLVFGGRGGAAGMLLPPSCFYVLAQDMNRSWNTNQGTKQGPGRKRRKRCARTTCGDEMVK